MDAFLWWLSTPPLWHVDAVGGRPPHHWKTTAVTAVLSTSGVTATALFDRATNGERFRAYVTDTLVPVLKRGRLRLGK